MRASATESGRIQANPSNPGPTITDTVDLIERLLDHSGDDVTEAALCESLTEQMRTLHARLRAQHALARCEATDDQVTQSAPELSGDEQRLLAEHSLILGSLDRLIRCVETVASCSAEDQLVFVLGVRELIATIRRHEAEEDRLIYLAYWRETGGES